MKMKTETIYFENLKDDKELSSKYKELIKLNHPDLGGNTNVMQEINSQYDYIKKHGYKAYLSKYTNSDTSLDFEDFKAKDVNQEDYVKVIRYCLDHNLDCELIGYWLWIAGDTKSHKDTLKELFCKYSGSKKRWYFAGRNFKKFKRGSGKSLNEIRETYGSSKFKYADSRLLTA